MYFEARVHLIRNITSRKEAAILIKEQKSHWYEALAWQGNTHVFLCVADGHIDNMFLEIAVLRQEPDGSFWQVESITAGWIETAEELEHYFMEAEQANPFKKVQLIVEVPKDHEFVRFICGCCGNIFQGNVKKQLAFNQDAGYGFCDRCAATSFS
ncbi:hypothetical protein [Chitinophaga cymbidii]|uniref:Uncharacterized protein n=1 Tax=Chitinophaga cymbidii TaxID=1096750 RepID=A0A512RPQ4_9BACT|nr:hypothetical protein [Chitinophaga cymbidii]GEP97683.1 hypothetical protein CCY01nite_39430 [Chitinophaga cymbidii]